MLNTLRLMIKRRLKIAEIDRCARAYGFEVGRGQPLANTVTTSPGNPFLDPEWRSRLEEQTCG